MKYQLSAEDLWADVLSVRAQSPLVHSITNFVAMNFNANVLLALGASPVMAHAIEEVEEMVGISGALVLNIGTLEEDWIRAMILAKKRARLKGIPVILDPVGAGATIYRNHCVVELLSSDRPNIIRGNASEIMSVAGLSILTKGVDSSASSDHAIEAAITLARQIDGVVCISGQIDHVIDARGWHAALSNGSQLMTKVTGVGCSATAMIGAFSAVQPDWFRATVAAMAYLGVAGEIAERKTKSAGGGSGSYQINLLDAVDMLDREIFIKTVSLELTQY
jgi:hydroxyethylthiazole kinase